jgi:hypothetical protein
MRFPVVLAGILVTFSCTNHAAKYTYADGNGNVYTITPTKVSFTPVQPHSSSSGTYSGGESRSVKITREQFRQLELLIEKSAGNQAIQLANRTKGSGLIIIFKNKDRLQYILQPESEEMKALENILLEYMNLHWITGFNGSN